jgi:hypothetical protein
MLDMRSMSSKVTVGGVSVGIVAMSGALSGVYNGQGLWCN